LTHFNITRKSGIIMKKPNKLVLPIIALVSCLIIGAIIAIIFSVYVATSLIIPLFRDYNISKCRVLKYEKSQATCKGDAYQCVNSNRYVKSEWECGADTIKPVKDYPCYLGGWSVNVLFSNQNETAQIQLMIDNVNSTINEKLRESSLEQKQIGQTYTCYSKKANIKNVVFEIPDTNKHLTGVILFVLIGITLCIFAFLSIGLFCNPLNKFKKNKGAKDERLLATYEPLPQEDA